MECPVKHHGFARLPGQTYNDGARALRSLLEKDNGDLLEKLFTEYAQEPERYSYDHQVVTYAVSSLVIEVLWRYVTGQESQQQLSSLRAQSAQGSYEERVQSFVRCYLKHLNDVRDCFVDDIGTRLKEGVMTKEDKLYLVFVNSQRKSNPEGKGLPVPSFNDLLMLLGRMAFVIPEVFLRDVGRAPTNDEVFSMVRNAYMLGFFTELMANARHVTLPLITCLEGVSKGDLDNPDHRFLPQFFKAEYVVGRPSVKVVESLAETYRSAVEKATTGKASLPVTLGCPALYTGKFREYFFWFCCSFEAWVTHP